MHSFPSPCHGSIRRATTATILLIFLVPALLQAQSVVVHRSFYFEDGDPATDADGAKNGVIVWKGGATHLVVNQIHVSKGEKLVIQPGAIVKFADAVDYVDGVMKSFKPPTDAGLSSDYYHPDYGGIIQIDGATLTDIRDDDVGGDSNQDGTATKPADQIPSLSIRFSGSDQDFLKNSTVKYFAKIGHLGSMKILRNTFENFGGISPNGGYPSGMSPIPIEASPEIIGNTFNFAATYGTVNLRGTSATVENNLFRSGGYGAALQIGLRQEATGFNPEGVILPQKGRTSVAYNTFETKGGVTVDADSDVDSLFTKASFRAIIHGNTFHPSEPTGEPAFNLCVDAEVDVINNTVENHTVPLVLHYDRGSYGSKRSPLHIHRNRFGYAPGGGRSGPNGRALYEKAGVMIDAENNYWGDPTGPLDDSNLDGLYNPRGKGFWVDDGIDYKPFIGGTTDELREKVVISATASPSPLVPGGPATINVAVDSYDMLSAPTGKIQVIVRDAAGYVLNDPAIAISVSTQNHTATVPPITITVPETTTELTVEASITPDGDNDGVPSNVVRFAVPQPKSAFKFLGAYDPVTGFPLLPLLTRGASLSARVDFEYTHTTSNVNFEIEFSERDARSGKVIEVLQQTSFSVPPGTNRKESKVLSLTIPFRDVVLFPSSNLYGRFVAKDDNGNVIGKVEGGLPIMGAANFVNIRSVVPVGIVEGNTSTLGRGFLVEGDQADFRVRFDHSVATKGVNNWQIWMGPIEVSNAAGAIVHTYPPAGPFASNVATGKLGGDMVMKVPDGSATIPTGARKARVYLRLINPQGNITVATTFIDLQVRPSPTRTAPLSVVAGAQTLPFAPIPVTLTFTSNTSAGTATAMEFNGQFGMTAARTGASLQAVTYWKFIPLNRYWAVFDTLKEGSFAATLAITYDPATDIPATAGFNEDSLVICAFNPYSNELEELPTQFDRSSHTLTTPYSKFFDTWVVASRSTARTSNVGERLDGASQSVGAFLSYPNPADERTTLRFELRDRADVKLEIVDAAGERVALLRSGTLEAGSHEIDWNTGSLPAGAYQARLRIGVEEIRSTMIVVR